MPKLASLPEGVALKNIDGMAAAVALTETPAWGGEWSVPAAARELPDLPQQIRVEPLSTLADLEPITEELFSVYDPPVLSGANGLSITTAEGLGAARGSLMSIGLEAAVVLCLFVLWEIWHLFR